MLVFHYRGSFLKHRGGQIYGLRLIWCIVNVGCKSLPEQKMRFPFYLSVGEQLNIFPCLTDSLAWFLLILYKQSSETRFYEYHSVHQSRTVTCTRFKAVVATENKDGHSPGISSVIIKADSAAGSIP